ncbi:MAG: hypothetical protein ACHQIG_03685 [Acidimicrobiia bacterium]
MSFPASWRARARARDLGFELSCEDEVGALLAALAAAVPVGSRVVELGTGAGVGLAGLAPVALVFADAEGGKIHGLDCTVRRARPRWMLVVDDMDVSRHDGDGLAGAIGAVRDSLVAHPALAVAELRFASGVMVATRRRTSV